MALTLTFTPTISGSGGLSTAFTPLNPIPAPAAAAGFNTLTFVTDVFTSSNVDMGMTTNPGFQWYFSNFLGITPSSGNTTLNQDGSISVGQTGPSTNVGRTISSATGIAGTPFFRGVGFGGGWYIQATFKFNTYDNTGSGGSVTSYPAFWFKSLEAYTNPPTSAQWPNQAVGFGHWSELDWEYASGVSFVGNVPYPGNMVISSQDWYGTGNGTTVKTSTQFAPTPFGGTYHTYGIRHIPATGNTTGSVVYYIDGTVRKSVSYAQFDCTNGLPVPPPSGNTSQSIVDCNHIVIIAGSGNANPITICNVQVWQVDTSQNMTN